MRNKPADVPYCGVDRRKILKAQPKLNNTNLNYLYRFITRRYAIHLRKDVKQKDPPWTKDPVLRDFRFTNIRREHDRETKWVIEHITSNPVLSYADKLINIVLFRLYNKHETAELIGMPIEFSKKPDWDPEWYRAVFEAATVENPNRVFFTTAFHTVGMKNTIRNDTGEPYAPMAILKFINNWVKPQLADQVRNCTDQQAVFNQLCSYNGIGDFLAYQIFVDMTYISQFPFSENEFTVAGPGCKMGLNYLFDDRDGMTHEEALFWLRGNLVTVFKEYLGKEFDPKKVFWDLPEVDRCFNVMSLENCMCELSKYIRAKKGTGRPRKKYKA